MECSPTQPPGFDHATLAELLDAGEDLLLDRICEYAHLGGFTSYTPPLIEAWRASVRGLTASIKSALERYEEPPLLEADQDYTEDPCSAFGILEAQRHRARGLSLEMFLSAMKLYVQSYLDLMTGSLPQGRERQGAEQFIRRFFDRLELGFITEWVSGEDVEQLEELRQEARRLSQEKNHYHTIFESLTSPALFIDALGQLRNWNLAASRIAGMDDGPGNDSYNEEAFPRRFAWLIRETRHFFGSKKLSETFEEEVECATGRHVFQVSLQRSFDISGESQGTIALLTDLTRLRVTERKLSHLRSDLKSKLRERDEELARLRIELEMAEKLLLETRGSDTSSAGPHAK